jgi:hypothetical protein
MFYKRLLTKRQNLFLTEAKLTMKYPNIYYIWEIYVCYAWYESISKILWIFELSSSIMNIGNVHCIEGFKFDRYIPIYIYLWHGVNYHCIMSREQTHVNTVAHWRWITIVQLIKASTTRTWSQAGWYIYMYFTLLTFYLML